MAQGTSSHEADADEFLRQWTIPEEDRQRHISHPWAGEFRWFRSENVIPLERVREQRRYPVALGEPQGPAS
jgi:hypothetical protein